MLRSSPSSLSDAYPAIIDLGHQDHNAACHQGRSEPGLGPVRATPHSTDGDGRIGSGTPACHSPRLEKNIGFAMLAIEHADMGNRFEVETPHERQAAVAVSKSFIDPTKDIPKQ